MTGSTIAALGVALPAREVTNDEIAQRLGVEGAWIEERTGIRARRIASPDETSATLGIAAARRALQAGRVDGSEIDLIICATVTPEWRFPATACSIQSVLGSPAAAYDINAGCSGFMYALAQADNAIRAGVAERVLVVGAEVLSRITDPDDPKTAILFGDGAGAALVERVDGPGALGPFSLYSDGSRPRLLYVPGDTGTIRMEGREVYRSAIASMAESLARSLAASGITADDVDLLVPHQANRRILDSVAARLGFPPEKVFTNIDRFGNTSSASIPIALAEAHATGALQDGDLVALSAFGAGFVWGAGLVQWGGTPADQEALVGSVVTRE